MTESLPTTRHVETTIERFLSHQENALAEISADLAPLVTSARTLLAGGKRLRAQFCLWGWRAGDGSASADALRAIDVAAAALEVFHGAALIHDDIIDNSDTRRGAPATHRQLETHHRTQHWSGDAEEFGRSSAILLGDLLLGWSDEILDEAIAMLGDRRAGRAARLEFNRMRTEVTAGQYLDVAGEHAWRSWPDSEHLDRAQLVALYKSAKYSIEAPLAIGAALAGAAEDRMAELRAIGVPLGIAFQLRDDLLGVFGDPDATGKPAGDDLREGKRTALIAQARRRLSAPSARLLDELLGDPNLTPEQIATLQSTLRASGAVDDVEQAIQRNADRALAVLDASTMEAEAREALRALVARTTQRTH